MYSVYTWAAPTVFRGVMSHAMEGWHRSARHDSNFIPFTPWIGTSQLLYLDYLWCVQCRASRVLIPFQSHVCKTITSSFDGIKSTKALLKKKLISNQISSICCTDINMIGSRTHIAQDFLRRFFSFWLTAAHCSWLGGNDKSVNESTEDGISFYFLGHLSFKNAKQSLISFGWKDYWSNKKSHMKPSHQRFVIFECIKMVWLIEINASVILLFYYFLYHFINISVRPH